MQEIQEKHSRAHGPVSIHFVRKSKEIDDQLQTISHQLKAIPSPEQTLKLTHILDNTASSLKLMKKEANRACGTLPFRYFETMEEEIIHMYGRLQDAVIAHHMAQIRQEMDLLQKAIEEKRSPFNESLVLEKSLKHFLKDYRPGLEERRIIAEAQRLIAFVKDPTTPSMPPLAELLFDDYELLFDIARSVYNHKIREAKAEYYQLPGSVREAVEQHLKHLMALLFEDATETIQALIATVHQILGNGEGYPTPSEIEEFFLGLAQITVREPASLLHDIKAPANNQRLSG